MEQNERAAAARTTSDHFAELEWQEVQVSLILSLSHFAVFVKIVSSDSVRVL